MGVSALVSHSKGAKHQERVKNHNPNARLFFARQSDKDTLPTDKAAKTTGRIDEMMNSVAVSHAEIRWAMKVVTSHFSYRSCLNLNSLLASMFPDSEIAKSFQLSKMKCSYYVVYGLAPYYKDELLESVKSSPAHSVLFDESLNHKLQDEQLDIQVRYWDNGKMEVQTRYLDSRFFKRPNADNIVEELLSSTKVLPEKKMLALSMDGPNTNWCVLDKLKLHREKNEVPQLMDIGSCGLHVVHGAFETGVKATGWELGKVLKAMWRLFNDSPARRDLYININRSDTFPLMFSETRWVEDESVAARAIEVWQFVVNDQSFPVTVAI